jgi:hypothetical protein
MLAFQIAAAYERGRSAEMAITRVVETIHPVRPLPPQRVVSFRPPSCLDTMQSPHLEIFYLCSLIREVAREIMYLEVAANQMVLGHWNVMWYSTTMDTLSEICGYAEARINDGFSELNFDLQFTQQARALTSELVYLQRVYPYVTDPSQHSVWIRTLLMQIIMNLNQLEAGYPLSPLMVRQIGTLTRVAIEIWRHPATEGIRYYFRLFMISAGSDVGIPASDLVQGHALIRTHLASLVEKNIDNSGI